MIPVKIGYRHVPNESGAGVCLESQVSYNIYKDDETDSEGPYNDFIAAFGTGYLSPPLGSIRINPGIRYETVFGAAGTLHYVAFRLAVNLNLVGRD